MNKSISKTAKYLRDDGLGDREVREETSEQFCLKYLLVIMNSSFARDWLAARRRSKMHVYPDDWKQLPIPPISKDRQQDFVRRVDAILREFKEHGHPLPPDAAARVKAIEAEIDREVAALYAS